MVSRRRGRVEEGRIRGRQPPGADPLRASRVSVLASMASRPRARTRTTPLPGAVTDVRLTRDAIVRTAVAIMDNEGLAAVSMRRLGHALGVTAMSLYSYVENKDAIMDAITDALFSQWALVCDMTGQWQDVERRLFTNLRHVLLMHPNALPLLMSRTARSEDSLVPIEFSIRKLRGAGFPDVVALQAHQVLMSFTLGYVMGEVHGVAVPPAFQATGSAAADLQDVSVDRFPHLSALGAAAARQDPDQHFAECLELVLGGLMQIPSGPHELPTATAETPDEHRQP